ncbi:MAG: AI-2E family transporter, partial [Thermomicrobiales bacterium]
RGLTRVQAILTVYVAILALIAFAALLIAPPLLSQASNLVDDVPNILQELRRQAADSPNSFINKTVWDALLRAERAWNEFRADPPIEGQQAVQLVSTTLSALLSIVTVLMVAFYWLTEKSTIKRLLITIFPAHRREAVAEIWETIEFKLGGWTRGQLTLCLIIGGLSTGAYFLMDLPFWLALGIFAGITEIVPFVGPIVGGGAAVTIALTDSWQKAVMVLIFVVLLQQLESALLVPRVMRHAVGMSPLTVILAVLIGGRIGGVLGSILAIPVGAMIQVLLSVILRGRVHPTESREADLVHAPPEAPPLALSPPPSPSITMPRQRKPKMPPGGRIARARKAPGGAMASHRRLIDHSEKAGSSSAREMASSRTAGSGDPDSR